MESNDQAVYKLVQDMGFSMAEATMALEDCQGDVNRAVEKILAGDYAPPPYSADQEQKDRSWNTMPYEPSKKDDDCDAMMENASIGSRITNFLGDLTHRKTKLPEVIDNSSAPSFFDLSQQIHSAPSAAKQMPPPYEIEEKEKKVKSWEEEFKVIHMQPNNPLHTEMFTQEIRCGICHSKMQANMKDIMAQYEDRQLSYMYYHGECFRKKKGPKCAHCCFPLSLRDKDHDLSGRYLVYQNKDYHVECYEKYAGPRCSYCFNVIIEKPNGEYSGSCVVDGNYQYHTECYEKKLISYWKAKNS